MTPTSIVDVLAEALESSGAEVLLVDPALGRTVTYRQFADLVEGAADALSGAGLLAGDRVAVLARNGLESAVAIWACARAGMVYVGLPVDAPPARLQELLDLVTPRLVLVQPHLASRLAVPVSPAAEVPLADAAEVPRSLADAAEVLLSRPTSWRAGTALPAEDTTYMLIPTSGTTGRPKAVRVTGRMAGEAAAFYVEALGLGPADRTAIHLPFSWVSGHITQLAPAMRSGGSAVTMAHYSAPELVATAVEHGVTWLDVVPSIWEGLLRCSDFRLPAMERVRLAVFGGAPAPTGTLERVRERLPHLALHDVYALSETCAPVTHLSDADAVDGKGTVGRPVPYVELKVVGDEGSDVGEVWVRSTVVTPGYWGDEPLAVDAEGWLRTGDLGRLDDAGRLTTAGRAVDLIIRGGVDVDPAEVERILLASGQVAEAVAYGVPSEVAGQNVAGAVVALPGVVVDVVRLRRLVQDALGPHAVPRPLRVLSALPRNANGKVDRAALSAQSAP